MLDTDYKSPTYNSYSTIAQMDILVKSMEVLNGSIGWDLFDDQTKEVYILDATDQVNAIDWSGYQDPDILVKSMKLPRIEIYVPLDQVRKFMACAIVRHSLQRGSGGDSGTSAGRVASKTVGGVTVTYDYSHDDKTNKIVTDEDDVCVEKYIDEGLFTIDFFGVVGSVPKTRYP